MRYFITGGAGFIGSNFARGLLEGRWGTDPELVTVFDALTYAGNLNNLEPIASDPRFRFVQGDIRNSALVRDTMQGHDLVVHFAAESHVDRSIESSLVFVETNVLGTQVLLDSARDSEVQMFIHISTDEVYGSIPTGSWDEEEPLLPNSPYAASKAASDLLVRASGKTHGLDVRVTRCSNNFGPYQFPEKVIPLFITNLIDGVKVPLYGNGQNIRDWLHVDDHCRAIDLVVRQGERDTIYNIGGGTEMTNLELTHLILGEFGRGEEWIEYVEDRKAHDLRYSVNWDKSHKDLGYTPQVTLKNEIPRLIAWYREKEAWWRPLKARPK